MDPSSSKADQTIKAEHENFRKQISKEEDDPLSPYEKYIRWLMGFEVDNPRTGVSLELLTILEETCRKFKDDYGYRGDLRFLKIWLTYAQRVENPDHIYVYLLKHGIGTIYAHLYEDYATSLESKNRFSEAEKTFQLGMSKVTRGGERLKTRYQEFQQRVSSKKTMKLRRPVPFIPPGESASNGAKLYRNPLRQIDPKGQKSKPTSSASSSVPPSKSLSSSSTQESSSNGKSTVTMSSAESDPYAYVKAAIKRTKPEPGKRAEKYRFDMSLLFKDGKEFCIEEARASSLGLLGKKWGPPPPNEPGPHQVHAQAPVDFGDDENRPATRTNFLKMNMNMTAQLANEPTVTINTKEALRDVFSMYNSPERTMKTGDMLIGTKHAPVRKLNLQMMQAKPRETLRKITELGDSEVPDSQGSSSRPQQTFRPYVDEGNRKENAVPPPAKFKIFVDENANSKPRPAPSARKGLALKEIPVVTPPQENDEEQKEASPSENAPSSSRPVFQETQPRSVFSKVFTPASEADKSRPFQSKGGILQDRPSVFRDAKPLGGGGGGLFGSRVFSRPPGGDNENSRPPAQAQAQAQARQQQTQQQQPAAREIFGSKPVFTAQPLPSQNQNENAGREPVFRRAGTAGASQRMAFAPVSRDRQPFAPLRQPLRLLNPEPEPLPDLSSDFERDKEPEPVSKPVLEVKIPREEKIKGPEPKPEPEPEPEPEQEEYVDEEVVEEYDEPIQDEDDYYGSKTPHRNGGRYGGGFMTPIAERTFECTMTTRTMLNVGGQHTHTSDKGAPYQNREAAEAAKQVIQEQIEADREEEEIVDDDDQEESSGNGDVNFEEQEGRGGQGREEDEDRESELTEQDEDNDDEMIERTGTLSLADAIEVASSFKPPNPCNPSDPHIVNTLLSLAPEAPDLYDLRSEISNRFEALQKFANKQARRGSGRSGSSKTSESGETFRIRLPDATFVITEKLGEGGFGAVYKAKATSAGSGDDDDGSSELSDSDDNDSDSDSDSDDGAQNQFALKVVKPRNLWEYHILQKIHNTLPETYLHSIITSHALYAYRDESFLVLDLCTQGTLLDVVNRASEAGVSQQHGGCLDELLVMFFTIELLKFLEGMHGAAFIHGDLKIDNCLLRLEDVPGGVNAWSGMYQPSGEGGWMYKGIKMIDFGRTIDTRVYPLPLEQRFVADWETDVYDCPEMREGRPWSYEPDYFGLAGICYCMLFGKYFDAGTIVRVERDGEDGGDGGKGYYYKFTPQFKRYWQGDIWGRLFDLLLNPTLARPDGSLPLVPELASIREEMETWLASNCNRSTNTLKGLLKKVERSVLSK